MSHIYIVDIYMYQEPIFVFDFSFVFRFSGGLLLLVLLGGRPCWVTVIIGPLGGQPWWDAVISAPGGQPW